MVRRRKLDVQLRHPEQPDECRRVFDFEDQDKTLNQIDLTIEKTVDASKGKFDWGFRVEWIWGGDARLIHSNGLNFYGPGQRRRRRSARWPG